MTYIHLPACRSRLLTRLGTRSLATEVARPQLRSRGILLHNIPTPSHLSTILDQTRVGSIERILYDPHKPRAFLRFFDSQSASKALARIKQANLSDVDARPYINPEKPLRLEAEIIAAIGYRHASRCIVINPIPKNTTEDSLKEELSRFGQVEKMEVIKKSEEKSFARVHFNTVRSALMADLTLCLEESMRGSRIHFTTERHDHVLHTQLNIDDPPLQSRSRTVLLTDLAGPVTMKRVLALVSNATVPLYGEVLQSIVPSENGQKYYLNFMRPEDALLFVNAFNSQTPKPLPEGGKVELAPPVQQELSYFHCVRAVGLGASRTLGISGSIDWKRLNRERIHADFSRFGNIINVSIAEAHNCAFISYSDLYSAMKAVDHVHLNNRNFRRYAGMSVSFTQDKASKIPRPIPLVIKTDPGAKADPVQDAPVARAVPSQAAKVQTSEVPSDLKMMEA